MEESINKSTACDDGLSLGCYLDSPRGLQGKVEYGLTVLLMVLLIVIGLINNACVILVVLKSPHLRRQLSYIFVLNLCFVDVLACVLILPFMIMSYAKGTWPFQEKYCPAEGFLITFLIILATTSVCAISVDRLYSIKSPMHYAANMTMVRAAYGIITVWLYAVFIALVPFFDKDSYKFHVTKMYCFLTWTAGWNHSSYIVAFSVLAFLFPCVVVIVMYIGIYKVARKTATQVRPMPAPMAEVSAAANNGIHERASQNGHFKQQIASANQCAPGPEPKITINGRARIRGNDDGNTRQLNGAGLCAQAPEATKSNKAVKTLLLIILTFVLLWAPFFLFNMHCALKGGHSCSTSADLWTSLLAFASFAVNPLIYGIMNRSVREEALESFRQLPSSCKRTPETDEPQANEDFFEFLERTSIAQPRIERPNRKSNLPCSAIAVVCGTSDSGEKQKNAITIQSASSMC